MLNNMRALSRPYMHLQMVTKCDPDDNENQPSAYRPDAQLSEPVCNSSDFAFIYATRYNDVKRWIRALGGNAEDLDDLAQEVFVVVNRRLHAFDGKNLPAWLYRIAVRQ